MGNVIDQQFTDRYAAYNGDCMEVMPVLGEDSVHMSVYSPPFAGLYHYTSSDRDLSNARSYGEFTEHYGYVIREIARLTMPGRITAVHCTDIPTGNSGRDALRDFPGDIIRLHQDCGWQYIARHCIWKEPLAVRNRTMVKDLTHKTIVDDATSAGVASADYLLVFRKKGDNPVPVRHPAGLTEYFGYSSPPADVTEYRGWAGSQLENKFSQWVWRQYASSVWDDIRGNWGTFNRRGHDHPESCACPECQHVLPYVEARDEEDEKHVHPLQLDVIRRAVILRTNPGEVVLTPFMGVGSEAYAAVSLGRRAIGIELKPSYYRQAVKNLESLDVNLAGYQHVSDA